MGTDTFNREHVFADIEPYICIYQNCSTGDAAYGSTEKCTAHQESAHVQQPTTACPLCYEFELDGLQSERQLLKHVFRHMESIGLFCLPSRLQNSQDEDCVSSTASTANSAITSSNDDEIRPGGVFAQLRKREAIDKTEQIQNWSRLSGSDKVRYM
jgi:hypothetical protein